MGLDISIYKINNKTNKQIEIGYFRNFDSLLHFAFQHGKTDLEEKVYQGIILDKSSIEKLQTIVMAVKKEGYEKAAKKYEKEKFFWYRSSNEDDIKYYIDKFEWQYEKLLECVDEILKTTDFKNEIIELSHC